MIHIYHAKKEIFRDSSMGIWKFFTEADCKKAFLNDKYFLVASIETNDFDEAYRLTNHIDTAWNDNDDNRMTVYGAGLPKRSTSVGDLMLTDDGMNMVDSFGFKKLQDFSK